MNRDEKKPSTGKAGVREREAYLDFVLEVAKELSFRTPRHVVESVYFKQEKVSFSRCPRCAATLERDHMKYCDRCGQCLEWDSEDDVIVFLK